MSKDSGGPKDPHDEITDKVVIPFRRRWKRGQEPPETLADGTVVEHMGRGWASWIFRPYPVVQNTCVGCLRKRREEHEACGFEDCDCFCMCGKLWPLWALFGLAPPEDQPVPPQLLGLGQKVDVGSEPEAEGGDRRTRRGPLWMGVSLAALVVAALVLGSGTTGLLKYVREVGSEVYGSLGGGRNLGERKVGRPMPHKPLPNQAVSPCRGSAKTFYGGCWIGPMMAPAPCPPDQFEEGGLCYVPEGLDPTLPVGE